MSTWQVESMAARVSHAAMPAHIYANWNNGSHQESNSWDLMGVFFGTTDPTAPPLNNYGGYPYARGVVTNVTLTRADVQPVPEPGTIILVSAGLIGLIVIPKRR
jgi:hypothetical protein